MVNGDTRLRAAILRQNIREIDDKVHAILAEQRLFRRYKFDLDVQDIQLTALREERAELVDQLKKTSTSVRIKRDRSAGLRSWLVLPYALGALAIQAVRPRQRRPRAVDSVDVPVPMKPSPGHSAS